MQRIKRVIASLLVVINIATLMPTLSISQLIDQAYADDKYIGGGDGDKTVSGAGSWSKYSTNVGYRMWLMDQDGNLVSDAGVVDLIYDDLPSGKEWRKTYNVKIQEWTGETAQNGGKTIKFSALNSTGFNGSLPRPIIAPNGGDYKGQGNEFRLWMTDGKAVVQAGGSGGSGGGIRYNYKGGGSTSAGGNNSSNPSGGGSTTTTPTVGTATQQINATYKNAFNTALSMKSVWTRNYAIQYINAQLTAKCDALCAGLTGTERRPIIDAMNSYGDMIDHELPYDFKSADASHFIDTGIHTDYLEIPKSNAVTEQEDGTLIIDLFELAYASDAGHELKKEGNIYPLLDNNKLFELDNLPQQVYTTAADGTKIISNLQTIAANKLKLIIEPIVWFQPATIVWNGKYKEDGKTKLWEIGTSPSWWFYGTPTTYASMMEYAKGRKGYWYDGGKGGWYENTLNKVAAQCLYLDGDLNTETKKPYISQVNPNNKTIANSDLSLWNKGYAMHYITFAYDGVNVPSTQTYDPFEKDPNPDPHKAPNPDPNYKTSKGITPVPFVEGEPTEEWNNDWTGYRQLTRTVNIVKCYDIEHMDRTIEHVKTEGRRWNPGTIDVMQEPDYKTVGWYTSPYYIGFDIFQNFTEIAEATDKFRIPSQMIFITARDSGDWDDAEGKSAWINQTYDTTWDGMRNRCIEISPEFGITAKYDKTIEYNEKAKAGEVVGSVAIGVVADLEYNEEKEAAGELPKEGYDDNTLYVHLIKKEKIPETSTYDEPDHQPSGVPPAVPPHPSQNPHDPVDPNFDPDTDHVDDTDPYCHYRIVKVYETITVTNDGEQPPESDGVFVTYKTNPIVYIQDEAQSSDAFDGSWHLKDWCVSDDYNNVPPPDLWEPITTPLPKKQSGTGERKVDLIDKNDKEKEVTLYVHLVRKIKEGNPTGAIIIQQSQISKTIHTNDGNIGGYFGNYTFQFYEGSFKTGHTTYFDHCCVPGDHRYHSCGCLGHWCAHAMPGSAGDDHLDFAFDLMSSQDDLEIKKGIHSDIDPKVYGKGGSAFGALKDGNYLHYPKTLTSLSREDFTFPGNGNSGEGAEYVTILWRGNSKYKDIPTLAKFKQNDIKLTFGSTDNYTIPDKLLSSVGSTANKVSNKKRSSTYWVGPLEFTFGLEGHGNRSDRLGVSSCINIGGNQCIDTDPKYVGTYDQFTYDFEAGVAIRFYAGKSKGLQAAPFGGPTTTPILEKQTGQHKELNVIQCKQQIKWYPYIRMTYMLNKLKDAEDEEQNTDTNGYKKDVRKDTYVLSEYD